MQNIYPCVKIYFELNIMPNMNCLFLIDAAKLAWNTNSTFSSTFEISFPIELFANASSKQYTLHMQSGMLDFYEIVVR